MGRKRSIDREELMQSVEAVARRSGVSGLSIDAVAKEAGVSKSSVVYDCNGKAGLLAAFTRYQITRWRQDLMADYAQRRDQPNAWLRSLIEKNRAMPDDDDLPITMLISASMGENAECREVMREALSSDTDRVSAEAEDASAMLRVLLTLHGMKFLECFGFHRFDQITRNNLLDDLMTTVDRDQGAPTT